MAKISVIGRNGVKEHIINRKVINGGIRYKGKHYKVYCRKEKPCAIFPYGH